MVPLAEVLLIILAVMVEITLCSLANDNHNHRPRVDALIGTIYGKRHNVEDAIAVDQFLGVPYAKAPVGELRFSVPVPFGHVGQLEAVKFGPRCPQPPIGPQPPVATAEDCLYLNVYRRAGTTQRSDSRPVIVIFHGGAFSIGSGSDPFFDGTILAAYQNVIVVNFNYRLGVLGFADMRDIAPGNLGLFDQRLALEWVQQNIAAFGGNPDRVTLIGVSAGSMSISAHLVSLLNLVEPRRRQQQQQQQQQQQLFHAAIMDGGVVAAGIVTDPELSLERMSAIAHALGCETTGPEMLRCLRQAKVDDLVRLSLDTEGYSPIYTFQPTADGVFLPAQRDNAQQAPMMRTAPGGAKVKVLIGYARDEGSMFAGYEFLSKPADLPDLSSADSFLDWCGKLAFGYKLQLNFNVSATRQAVLEAYYDDKRTTRRGLVDAVASFVGDGSFICPVNAFVDSYGGRTTQRSNVCFYRFERRLRRKYLILDPDTFGVPHISPFAHFTGCLLTATDAGTSNASHAIDAAAAAAAAAATAAAAAADKMFFLDAMQMVADFAGSDGPPAFRGVQWPDFTDGGQQVMVLNDSPHIQMGRYSENRCKKVFGYLDNGW